MYEVGVKSCKLDRVIFLLVLHYYSWPVHFKTFRSISIDHYRRPSTSLTDENEILKPRHLWSVRSFKFGGYFGLVVFDEKMYRFRNTRSNQSWYQIHGSHHNWWWSRRGCIRLRYKHVNNHRIGGRKEKLKKSKCMFFRCS